MPSQSLEQTLREISQTKDLSQLSVESLIFSWSSILNLPATCVQTQAVSNVLSDLQIIGSNIRPFLETGAIDILSDSNLFEIFARFVAKRRGGRVVLDGVQFSFDKNQWHWELNNRVSDRSYNNLKIAFDSYEESLS